MNDYLKEAGKIAGLDSEIHHELTRAGKKEVLRLKTYEVLSTHVARRSFATNFYNLGVSASILMRITSHSKESQFHEYICTSDLDNAILMIDRVEKLRERFERKIG